MITIRNAFLLLSMLKTAICKKHDTFFQDPLMNRKSKEQH